MSPWIIQKYVDVRTNIFQSIDFLKFLLQLDNDLLFSKCKKVGVTRTLFREKRVENYLDFEKLSRVSQRRQTVLSHIL